MWIGELDKSDTTKLTGSADQSGIINITINITHIMIKLIVSLYKKRKLNLIIVPLNRLNPPGRLLPLKWRTNKWTPAINKTMKGTRKCKAKKKPAGKRRNIKTPPQSDD